MGPETAPPPCRLSWSAMTHRGRVRPNNEDSFLALNFDGHELRYLGKTGEASARNTDFVFAVSDGMGGANSGEFASRIAVDHITALMPKSFRMSAMGLASGFADILQQLFADIHQVMLKHGRSYEECAGMGATLSLCWFTPQWMYFGHLGDSRIYYLPKDGGMTQITHDHSHVGWLRRQGKLNEREARSHPQRNALNQALGAGHQFIDPHVGAVGFQPGDRFLICSDGLTDGLWDRALQELIREPAPALATQDPARRLVEGALEASGRDNITAIVIETKPAES
jgi:serine/threonine protein phosphatase PrpC